MLNPGQEFRLKSSARTNTGRVRDNNEDSVYLWTQNDHVVLGIVADGMGGAVAGEEASRIAVDTIQAGFAAIDPVTADGSIIDYDHLTDRLKQYIQRANSNIVDQAGEQPELKGMGTTLTLAFVYETSVVIGHVGDSRAYLIHRDTHIEQITSDHSFVQALVAAGYITEDEAEEHPMRNVLYRALGQAHDVEVDVYYERMHVGDRLVLCSDGLTLHVKPHEIADIALRCENPEDASSEMIALANERGGRDNVSVIVIKAEGSPDTPAKSTETANHATVDYDEEDTLVAYDRQGFSSSESSNAPQQEQRDTSTQQRESPGVFDRH